MDEVLTTRVNSLLGEIALLSKISVENKKGDLLEDCLFGSQAATIGASLEEFAADVRTILDTKIKNL